MMTLIALMLVVFVALRCADFVMARLAERLARVRDGNISTGHSLDAAAIHPRICEVRDDFVGRVRARNADADHHFELVQTARRTMANLPFFQARSAAPVAEEAIEGEPRL